jgi:hypothetical protein
VVFDIDMLRALAELRVLSLINSSFIVDIDRDSLLIETYFSEQSLKPNYFFYHFG